MCANEDALRERVRELRGEVAAAVVEMEDIRLQQIPQIKREYALRIGCWETRLLEAELAARRAKRKFELMCAQANAGEKPSLSQIEERLDAELAAWQQSVQETLDAYQAIMEERFQWSALGAGDSHELKRLFRLLAKRLHPDLKPRLGPQEAHFFLIAQELYRSGDLEGLRSLEVATAHLDANSAPEDVASASELSLMVAAAEAELAVTLERLEYLKHQDPYPLRELLANAEWLHERVGEFKAKIAEWEEMRAAYDSRIAALEQRSAS